MTHYSPNAPVDWTPLSKRIKYSSPMTPSVIIAFSLCSHESRAQHLCEYLAHSSRNLSESLLRRYYVNNNCDLGYCPADRGVLGYYACYVIALYRPGLPHHGFHVNCA